MSSDQYAVATRRRPDKILAACASAQEVAVVVVSLAGHPPFDRLPYKNSLRNG